MLRWYACTWPDCEIVPLTPAQVRSYNRAAMTSLNEWQLLDATTFTHKRFCSVQSHDEILS
eukprot:4147166-Pleurochrysis_carterae.AAC.1